MRIRTIIPLIAAMLSLTLLPIIPGFAQDKRCDYNHQSPSLKHARAFLRGNMIDCADSVIQDVLKLVSRKDTVACAHLLLAEVYYERAGGIRDNAVRARISEQIAIAARTCPRCSCDSTGDATLLELVRYVKDSVLKDSVLDGGEPPTEPPGYGVLDFLIPGKYQSRTGHKLEAKVLFAGDVIAWAGCPGLTLYYNHTVASYNRAYERYRRATDDYQESAAASREVRSRFNSIESAENWRNVAYAIGAVTYLYNVADLLWLHSSNGAGVSSQAHAAASSRSWQPEMSLRSGKVFLIWRW